MAATDAAMTVSLAVLGYLKTTTVADDQIQRFAENFASQFTFGTSTNQINAAHASTRNATSETIDLNAGTLLTDLNGANIVFTTVRAFIARNRGSVDVTLSGSFVRNGSGTGLFLSTFGTLALFAGSTYAFVYPGTGFAVTVNDQILVTNGSAVSWDLIVLGVA